ncbi:polyphosphate--glucose phosphotransferase [Smaragdicoccus niigatensis]|uniref:polyphosphate--glucose phosphotransferase n=1 Tax=Smaragdicoccus niigatensis TaxID=359359 RepID=UPI00035FF923|nr:ROK family protein [Smaragdicoccus niigatensis]
MTETAGQGFGIDVGGTGIKGAIVDLATGELAGERIRIETPKPATPEAVAATVAEIAKQAGWTGPVGVTMPAVVLNGVTKSAANIDESWVNADAGKIFTEALGGVPVAVLNDADAAGLAEDRFGAAAEAKGLIIMLTFGTGIGSAIIYNGVLIPNSELGHLEMGGKEAEHRAAASVKENNDMSYKDWCKQVSKVLTTVENLFWPDLFIAGGGISKKSEKWIPLLTNRTPIVPAKLLNTAGIVGAAMAANSLANS